MENLREQWLILVSVPIYLIIILSEIFISHWQQRARYTLQNTLANVWLMLLNGGIDLGIRVVSMAVLQFFFLYRVVHWHGGWAYWAILVITEDFIYYWLHRFDHEIRFFWATHVTHHSSELMNFTVGFRSSVFQPLYRFLYFIPLPLMGFEVIDIVFVYAATQIWGIFVHTELIDKMGFLEHILVTPSHHRVHHASNPLYLDKNMGMFLILWDKLFGTFQEELQVNDYAPIKYGLTKHISFKNPLHLVFHEWVALWRDATQKGIAMHERWKYIFGPPGYSHDGSSKTSREMRLFENAEWETKNRNFKPQTE